MNGADLLVVALIMSVPVSLLMGIFFVIRAIYRFKEMQDEKVFSKIGDYFTSLNGFLDSAPLWRFLSLSMAAAAAIVHFIGWTVLFLTDMENENLIAGNLTALFVLATIALSFATVPLVIKWWNLK